MRYYTRKNYKLIMSKICQQVKKLNVYYDGLTLRKVKMKTYMSFNGMLVKSKPDMIKERFYI